MTVLDESMYAGAYASTKSPMSMPKSMPMTMPMTMTGGCPDLSPQDQDCCHTGFGAAVLNQFCVAGKSATKGTQGAIAPCKLGSFMIPIPCWATYGIIALVAVAVIVGKIH